MRTGTDSSLELYQSTSKSSGELDRERVMVDMPEETADAATAVETVTTSQEPPSSQAESSEQTVAEVDPLAQETTEPSGEPSGSEEGAGTSEPPEQPEVQPKPTRLEFHRQDPPQSESAPVATTSEATSGGKET